MVRTAAIGGLGEFEHVADPGRRTERRLEVRPLRPKARRPSCEPHETLAPAALRRHELADGQRIEELVGDHDRRAGRHRRRDRRASGSGRPRRRGRPPAASAGRGSSRPGAPRRRSEVGPEPGGAERVRHEGSPPGAELHERERGRAPHRLPDGDGPETDEFAEHLADLRRGREIAARPERIAGRVVVPGAQSHVALDGDRPLLVDQRADMPLEGGHAERDFRQAAASSRRAPRGRSARSPGAPSGARAACPW